MVVATDRLRLAELSVARLCHELSGVIGTISAALDLLKSQTATRGEAATLADDAADELVSRLRLLRAAWGPDSPNLTLAEARTLCLGLEANRRVTIDWTRLPPETVFSARIGRLILNLVMLACESIPDRGSVLLDGSADDLFVRPVSPRAAWPAALSAALIDLPALDATNSDPRDLQTMVTVLQAAAAGATLSLPIGLGARGGAAPLRLLAP